MCKTETNQGGEREDLLMRLRVAAGQVAHEYPVTHCAITDAIAALSPSEQPEPVAWPSRDRVGMTEVEMVSYETGFQEPAPSVWRLEIDGYCADFETASAAINFRDAIISLYAQPSKQTGGGDQSK